MNTNDFVVTSVSKGDSLLNKQSIKSSSFAQKPKKYRAPLPPTGKPPAGPKRSVSDITDRKYTSWPQQISTSVHLEENEVNGKNISNGDQKIQDSDLTKLITNGNNIYDQPICAENISLIEKLMKCDGYVKVPCVEVKDDNRCMDEEKSVFNPAEKPSISNVKLVQNEAGMHAKMKVLLYNSSQASGQLNALLDMGDFNGQPFVDKSFRSSFVDPNGPPTRRSVYIDMGEYQTLLKHSKNEEHVYSLPQPQCYGVDTLKAVKLITEKYDTFKRRQLRALSFRDGTVQNHVKLSNASETERNSEIESSPIEEVPVLNGLTTNESNNNKDGPDTSNTSKQDEVDVMKLDTVSLGEGQSVSDHGNYSIVPSSAVSSETTELESALLRDYCAKFAEDQQPYNGGVSKIDRMRIEIFYRSREASVFVCSSLADLFIGTMVKENVCPSIHLHTGVPVWLLNFGSNLRRRELLLILAERESGFPLWQDKINYLSNYSEVSSTIHTLCLSGSLSKSVRLQIFSDVSAKEFMEKFLEMTGDPQDDLWKISEERRKHSMKLKSKSKKLRISKSSISRPCNFVHVSHIDPKDANFRAAFSNLFSKPTSCNNAVEGHENQDRTKDSLNFNSDDGNACEFRPRLPTR